MWTIRVATGATALITATTIAWAGLGHLSRWVKGPTRAEPGTLDAASPVASRLTRHPLPRSTVLSTEPIVSEPTALLPGPGSVSLPSAEVPRARRRSGWTDRSGDSGLVVEAMRALRMDGDPALARALCRMYLDRHPNGAVAEEALALTVEAAIAHGDTDAPALGARYLREHPNGPFRGLARQASHAAVSPTPAPGP